MYENYNPGVPESEFPTIWQMKHFFKREYSQVEKLKKRISKIDYNKDIRPLLATANTQALGGSRYEIDATIADIYLVSDSDRQNIVGRPIVYMVIDVFSRMVAGFYIGFENPSYVAAMQTLSMAMTDKIKLCQQFGIEIDESDWPVTGIPDAILADRGELLGCQIESLEKSFSTRIENTPPLEAIAKA
jgi:transposase InsO family protein